MAKLKWQRSTERGRAVWRSGVYEITRWYARAREFDKTRVPQYVVTFRDESIFPGAIYTDLKKAKAVAEQHARLMEVRAARRRMRRNPWRAPSEMTAAARRRTQAAPSRQAAARRNPTPARRAQLEEAIKLYRAFRGDDPGGVVTVKVPPIPSTMLTVGECIGIMYRTERDGEVANYLHRFRQSARPTLAVSSDGRSLYLLGGAYRVTDRGIVDDA